MGVHDTPLTNDSFCSIFLWNINEEKLFMHYVESIVS